MPERRPHAYRRHGIINLFAAPGTSTSQVHR
jgi:hypothetical protein